jgi:hypothetical protein
MTAAGVPGDKIIETNQMYKLPDSIDAANTIFITAVGAPDADRLNPDTYTKRDQKDKEGNVTKPAGSPSYYKTWGGPETPVTADQHGYVIVIPEIHKEVTIKGQKYDVSHGTECRNLWNSIRNDAKARTEFLSQMYARPSQELAAIFDKIPQTTSEDISADSQTSTSPIHGTEFKQGVAEGAAETSWSNDTDTITLHDILELTKHIKQINLPINDNLKSKLLHWEGNPEEIERVNQVTVSNQFPILIMVDEQGQIAWILDGNHRLHKAIQSQAKTIPAKLIRPSNLDDKAKKIFNIKEQGVAEDAAGVGVVAKNKKMARDPRYSMSITKDVKPSTPKNMLRAFRLSEQEIEEGIHPYGTDIWGRPEMPDDIKPASYVFPGIISAYKAAQKQGMKVVKSAGGRFKLAPLNDPNPELVPNPKFPEVKQKVQQELDKLQSIYDSVGKTMSREDFFNQYAGGFGQLRKQMSHWNKVLSDTPTFVEKSSAIKEDENNPTEKQIMSMVKNFLPLVMKELKIKKLPKIIIKKHIETTDGQATFGRFVNEEEKIYLGIADRHPVDILRTLAHELVHFKQYEQGRMEPDSGDTGSPIENEANAVAGVLMRYFNKKYPDAVKSSAVSLDESLFERYQQFKENGDEPDEVRKQKNLIPFPKGTVKVDVSDVYDWYKLGQEISDLDDANPADFGKGPPQTVMAFGSEPEEHRYLKDLKRLGLKTHDIDENFADGRNPQDKGDSKRYKVPTKGKISTLRKIAKQGGRRGQLAHWMANMRSGKNKK